MRVVKNKCTEKWDSFVEILECFGGKGVEEMDEMAEEEGAEDGWCFESLLPPFNKLFHDQFVLVFVAEILDCSAGYANQLRHVLLIVVAVKKKVG